MYLYVHGFNSSIKSRSYFDLYEILDNVVPLAYDYTQTASFCFAELCEQMDALLKNNINIKILGSSLGGFWAMHLAKKYKLASLTFNPVTFAHEQLRPFLGKNQNFYTQEQWDFTNKILMSYADFILDRDLAIKPRIILGNQDEILDYTIALDYWKEYADCRVTCDIHSIMDYSQYKDLMLCL